MIDLGDVRLRKLEEHDLDALYTYRNAPDILSQVSRFTCGMSRSDLTRWLAFHSEQRDEVLLAIATAADDRCLGHVGLYQIDHRVGKAEFGIIIGDHDTPGLGRRVSEAMFALAFDSLNLQRIWIEIIASNERSLHVYEKIGFILEGVLRNHEYRDGKHVDCVRMSLLRSEWRRGETA